MSLGLDGIEGHIGYLASIAYALYLSWRTPNRYREQPLRGGARWRRITPNPLN